MERKYKIELNKTKLLERDIISEMERFIKKRKQLFGNYSKTDFCKKCGIRNETMRFIRDGRPMTLDNAIRILDSCGLDFKIVIKTEMDELYDHKDIIHPSMYDKK